MSGRRLLVLGAAALLLPVGLAGAGGGSAGDIDLTFGDGGHFLAGIGEGAYANAATVQLDGKVVLAGANVP